MKGLVLLAWVALLGASLLCLGVPLTNVSNASRHPPITPFQNIFTPQRARPIPAPDHLPWGEIFWRMAMPTVPNLQATNTLWDVVCSTNLTQHIPTGADPQPTGQGQGCNSSQNWVTPFVPGCLSDPAPQNTCSIFLSYSDYIYNNPTPWNNRSTPTSDDRNTSYAFGSSSQPQWILADQFNVSGLGVNAFALEIILSLNPWVLNPGVVRALFSHPPRFAVHPSPFLQCLRRPNPPSLCSGEEQGFLQPWSSAWNGLGGTWQMEFPFFSFPSLSTPSFLTPFASFLMSHSLTSLRSHCLFGTGLLAVSTLLLPYVFRLS